MAFFEAVKRFERRVIYATPVFALVISFLYWWALPFQFGWRMTLAACNTLIFVGLVGMVAFHVWLLGKWCLSAPQQEWRIVFSRLLVANSIFVQIVIVTVLLVFVPIWGAFIDA